MLVSDPQKDKETNNVGCLKSKRRLSSGCRLALSKWSKSRRGRPLQYHVHFSCDIDEVAGMRRVICANYDTRLIGVSILMRDCLCSS